MRHHLRALSGFLTGKLQPLASDMVTRAWTVVLAGNVVRLALGFAASVLIARTLGPSDFGVYAVLAATVSIVGVVADVGLTAAAVKRMAAVRETDPGIARERAQPYFWLRTGAAVLVVAIGLLLADPLSHGLGLSDGTGLLQLALLGVVATALSGAINGIFQAIHRFGRLALVQITNAGLTVLLAAGLAVAGHLTLVTALIVLGIGASLASFGVGYRLLPAGWRLELPSRSMLREEGAQLFRFGRWLWIGSMLAVLVAQFDVLLVNQWYEPATVGAYALALNLASKVDVVNHSLYTVLMPTASALENSVLEGTETFGRYIRRGLLRSALISLGLLGLIPLAEPFILTFYGPAYAAAIDLFRLLLGVVIFDTFTVPLLLLAFPLNRPRLLAAADAVRVLTLVIAAAMLLPTYGPTGAIVAKFCAKVAGAALTLVVLARQRLPPRLATED